MEIQKAIEALNSELKKIDCKFTLYICGGAALKFLGIITRDTVDIDVIEKGLDPVLIKAKDAVAKRLHISEQWLNNKVGGLISRLSSDWMETSTKIFNGSNLVIFALSRQNLINSKLHAAVDRHAEDYDDLISLAPSINEIEVAQIYTLKQSGKIETYEVFVKALVKTLKEELGLK